MSLKNGVGSCAHTKVTQITFSPEANKNGPFWVSFLSLLTLADDFRTIDWMKAYPHPMIALEEIRSLLSIKA